MGPSVKFVSPNKGLISKKKKMGVNFFRVKNDQTEGGLAKDHTFSRFFFFNLPLTWNSASCMCYFVANAVWCKGVSNPIARLLEQRAGCSSGTMAKCLS